MKRCIVLVAILLCSNIIYGQNKKTEKYIEISINANEHIIADLTDTIDFLSKKYNKLDSTLKIISKRQFPIIISESELKEELSKITTIRDIWANKNNIHRKLKLAKDTDLAKNYYQIINIYNSLTCIYNESVNKENIKLLKDIRELSCHSNDYKKINLAVNNYEIVMYELARVINIIDHLNGTPREIKDKLIKDDELRYILKNNIPYVNNCIDKYINFRASSEGEEDKLKLLEELKTACPGAFSNF